MLPEFSAIKVVPCHSGIGRVKLIAGVPEEHTDDVAAALDRHWPVVRGRMDPDQWVDSWRPYAKAARLSGGIVVQPPWIAPIAEPGDLVVSLDPGRAWGHGAHPSTLLAAEEMRRFGIEPKVALISHSSFGNEETASARKMRDVFGAKDPRSWMLRFHSQTAGSTLTPSSRRWPIPSAR